MHGPVRKMLINQGWEWPAASALRVCFIWWFCKNEDFFICLVKKNVFVKKFIA